jgi:transcription initiation factor TFIIIB Brf1 subunit/transcription initiation factor TFIIB
LLKRSEYTAAATSGKAWRFVGEMLEISETYSDAGLPDSFHTSAAAIYERMSDLKDLPPQTLDAVVAALLKRSQDDL